MNSRTLRVSGKYITTWALLDGDKTEGERGASEFAQGIESSQTRASVFTSLVETLGTKNVEFAELWSLDDDALGHLVRPTKGQSGGGERRAMMAAAGARRWWETTVLWGP